MPDRPLSLATFLPTAATTGNIWSNPDELSQVAQWAESLGFDDLWVGDHYLTSPVHGESWLDPFTILSFLAGATERIGLGPAIIVGPVRHPIWLAKQAADLQWLSGGRFKLGLATGFSQLEFDAVGIPREERGTRQDEILRIVQRLLSGSAMEFDGKHYTFPELRVEPTPSPRVPVLVAGGSQPDVLRGDGTTHDDGEVARAGVRQSVIDRIASSDGWITPTYSPTELIAADWKRINDKRVQLGVLNQPFTFAHMNFVHVVDTDDRDEAHHVQRPLFEHHFGPHRPWERIREGHMVGTVEDILERIEARIAVGCNYVCLQPVVRDVSGVTTQMELIAHRIMEPLRDRAQES